MKSQPDKIPFGNTQGKQKKKTEAVLIEDGKTAFVCTTDDLHPYECEKDCIHCNKTQFKWHNSKECALCKDL